MGQSECWFDRRADGNDDADAGVYDFGLSDVCFGGGGRQWVVYDYDFGVGRV